MASSIRLPLSVPNRLLERPMFRFDPHHPHATFLPILTDVERTDLCFDTPEDKAKVVEFIATHPYLTHAPERILLDDLEHHFHRATDEPDLPDVKIGHYLEKQLYFFEALHFTKLMALLSRQDIDFEVRTIPPYGEITDRTKEDPNDLPSIHKWHANGLLRDDWHARPILSPKGLSFSTVDFNATSLHQATVSAWGFSRPMEFLDPQGFGFSFRVMSDASWRTHSVRTNVRSIFHTCRTCLGKDFTVLGSISIDVTNQL
jgi:hypothetical protein